MPPPLTTPSSFKNPPNIFTKFEQTQQQSSKLIPFINSSDLNSNIKIKTGGSLFQKKPFYSMYKVGENQEKLFHYLYTVINRIYDTWIQVNL